MPPPPLPDLLEQLRVALHGTYCVERELGWGGMGRVFLAHDLRLDRRVAIKIIRPEISAMLGGTRFLREISIAAQLQHPHIVPLFESGEVGGVVYYVMPFVEGETLRDRLAREKQLPLDDALRIALDVASALEYAHSSGFVHRDIKPSNILLSGEHALVADFGLARAIGSAAPRGMESVTTSGLVLGTPPYMAPEQGLAGQDVDGRSDIYSLGCVLYEMLAGDPPFAAVSPVAMIAKHIAQPPPSVRVVRSSIPEWVDAAILRALEKSPADRFQTADAMGRALRGGAPATEPRRRSPRRAALAAAVAVSAVMVGGLGIWRLAAGPGLDSELHVVLPFRLRPGAQASWITSDLSESLLYDALSRWGDARLVNSMWVRDAVVRRGGSVTAFGRAVDIAREAGAGLMVWGEIWRERDTTFVRGALYDVTNRGREIRYYTVRLAESDTRPEDRFTELASALLLGGLVSRVGQPASLGTSSIAAVRAYGVADSAMSHWNLDLARASLTEALSHDPGFTQANLRLALVYQWLAEPVTSWRTALAAVLARPERLTPVDRELAEALHATTVGQLPRACQLFRRRIERDSLDLIGWLGLGDCQARDSLVLAGPSSSSGWRFRSSQWAAISAYRRALTIIPSAHLAFRDQGFRRLRRALFTGGGFREGYLLNPDTVWFAAWPSWDGDSLAFIPYPRAEVIEGRPHTVPHSLRTAVAQGRRILRELGSTWVQAFPDSAQPRVLVAEMLEVTGDLDVLRPERDSALRELRRATQLSGRPIEKLDATVAQVRVLLKLGAYRDARRVADSLLAAWPDPQSAVARKLAPLAVLTGKPGRAADLLVRSAGEEVSYSAAGEPVQVPTAVAQPALRLLAFAAVGAPADTLDRLELEAERAIRSLVPTDRQPKVSEAMLDEATMLAFPTAGLRKAHRPAAQGRYLLELQWRAARGDSATVADRLAFVASLRRATEPGEVAVSAAYLEAGLLLAVGDSAAAVDRLDLALEALAVSRVDLLDAVAFPAALVRAMALRAMLAHASGERAVAARWSRAVLDLWDDAEPPVRPTTDRMKAILSPPRGE